ncbi:MAG: protocatechuate 3,4-dioxygenase [Bacteroidota bacterium]
MRKIAPIGIIFVVILIQLSIEESYSSHFKGGKFPTTWTGNGYSLCGSCSVPKNISSRVNLTNENEPGDPLVITGTIYERDGFTPAAGVTLFLYQTDAQGYYHRPQEDVFEPRIFGWLRTGSDGRYEIHTIKPAREFLEINEPAHIHIHVFSDNIPEHYIKEFWFADDPAIKSTEIKESAKLGAFSPILHLTRGKDGVLKGVRDIKLQPTEAWQYQSN